MRKSRRPHKVIKLVLAFLCLLTAAGLHGACSKSSDTAAAPSPKGLVADLYRQPDTSLYFQDPDPERVGRYLTERLGRLLLKDASATPEGELGALDFDPLYDAQDLDIRNFVLRERHGDGGTREVVASFENMGAEREVVFVLVSTAAGWRIDDIEYPDGRTLAALLGESGK